MKKFLAISIFIFLIINISFSKEFLSEDSETLDVYFEKIEEGGYLFYGDNNHFIPQFISLGFTKLTNLKMDRANPSQVVLEPGDKGVLLATLTPLDKNRSYSFRSRLSYTPGNPLTVEPDDFVYLFPFEHGSKFKLDQGFGGQFSHQKENYYALDFSMDIGTPIVAARAGIVVEVKEDSNRGGASSSYASYGNFISIYHDDGTFASYVHLKKNGAIVEVGDSVSMGDTIGYSGNTGLSTGPHLHFSVNVPTVTGSRQSIPIKLLGLDGEATDPVVGEYYYSKHPGGESFDPVFGKDLKDSDFSGTLTPIKQTDKLSFRDESIDSTTVVYCRNGFNSVVEGTITFKFQNSFSSQGGSIPIKILPLSESYVALVKPKDTTKSFAFSYSISYRVLE